MDDRERLAGYVDIWWRAIDDFTALLEHVPAEQWHLPTDLPGWDVHAVAAHTAHLESVLAGAPEETLPEQVAAHAVGPSGVYTEAGVVARRDRTPDELINEIRESATRRHTRLVADPPADGSARPDRVYTGASWDWETLLRNRPLDVWMHEQDVRRAVGRPGGLDAPAAAHTVRCLSAALGYVVGKRLGAPPGTTVVLEVAGSEPAAVVVDDRGRADRLAEIPPSPTVRLSMDRETFVLVAGGRRAPEPGAVRVDGDAAMAERILDLLAVTP